MINIFSQIVILIIVAEIILFGVSVIIRRQDFVDILWGPKIAAISLTTLALTKSVNVLNFLLIMLVIIWAARLATHIALRRRGSKEDKRYLEISRHWGKYFYLRSFLQTFILQGFLALLVASPVIMSSFNSPKINLFIIFIGLFFWSLGFVFETVADFQLYRFTKNKKTGVMDKGLWRYSRHPNYFGEVLLWWGIFIVSISNPENFFIKILGPITITVLIFTVSGIPMLEKRYKDNIEYQKYAKKTSIFFPLTPKR